MSMKLGSVPTLVVSSARIAKQVFQTHDLAFASRPSLHGQRKLSYNGLDVVFSPYSDYWREMRKVCVLHLFSSKRSQSFRPIREDEVARLVKKIRALASSSELVNLNEILMTLTTSIICRVAFGKRYDEEGSERSRFHDIFNESQAMFGSFFVSDYFPLMGWIDKLRGISGRLEKNFKDMDSFYQELINEHLNSERTSFAMKGDILDILLQLKRDKLFSFDLTFDHIKGVLMNIVIAGSDTSLAAVVWAMTGLMQNPTQMKKVQEEIRKTIGKKGHVDEDDLQELVYLKAVIKETMRLFPPAPLLVPRETIDSCVIEGYEIQPKTLVYVNAWAIGRDPEAWENPEEFLPERFLGNPIDFKGQDFELIPFGAGRRGCPAIAMGAATTELTLANLLYSFDWELPDGKKQKDIDTDVKPGITMHKKNALCLVAKVYSIGINK